MEGEGAITCNDRGYLVGFEDRKSSNWCVNTVCVESTEIRMPFFCFDMVAPRCAYICLAGEEMWLCETSFTMSGASLGYL